MAIDPSIYAQLGVGVTPLQNPLDTYSKAAQTANALTGLQANQLALAGRVAAGRAYQGVTFDPKTGLPTDPGALIANLQQTPAGAAQIPAVLQGLQEQQKRNFDLNKQQLDQTTARTNVFNNAMSSLITKGPNTTLGDIIGTAGSLHASGFPTDEFAADMQQSLPVKAPGMSDAQYGAQLHNWVVSHAARSWPAATQASTFSPNIATVDNGGVIITRDTNPYTNPGITSAPPILKQASPPDQMNQVPGPLGPNGEKTVIPAATYARQNGMGNLIPGGTASPQNSPLGTGRLPPALMNPNRPAPAAPAPSAPPGLQTAVPQAGGYVAPAAPPMAGGQGAPPPTSTAYAPPATPQGAAPMVVGLGPGQTTALTAQGTQGQDAAGSLSALAQDSPARQAQISAMLGDLTKYGSGPNSPIWQTVRGRLVQMGEAPQDWTEGVAAQENFTKMANQFLAKQASGMGPVTNDKLALAAESGPNPLFTTLGNQGVLHIAQGNEDALNVKNQAWNQATLPVAQGGQGLTGANYQAWSTQFNQGFSPSAFWYARMAPAERQTLVAGMSSDQQAALQGSIVDGINRGWINPTLLTQPAAGTAAPTAPPASAAPAAAAPPAS